MKLVDRLLLPEICLAEQPTRLLPDLRILQIRPWASATAGFWRGTRESPALSGGFPRARAIVARNKASETVSGLWYPPLITLLDSS